jgi:hypothetical protein
MTDITKPSVVESAEYDNYLNIENRKTDVYNPGLDKFFDEPIETPVDQSLITRKIPKNKDYVRLIKVHFNNIEDHLAFCNTIGQVIPFNKNETYFPLEDIDNALIDDRSIITDVDIELIRPRKSDTNNASSTLGVEDHPDYIGEKEWMRHWHDMPTFSQTNKESYKHVYVKVRTEKDLLEFEKITGHPITDKTKYMWYPKTPKSNNMVKRWIGEYHTNPKYPMYIVSKGRHESMFTSRTFAAMKIPHYIVIEPQDYDRYVVALEQFKINPYATLLVAPFSNHGDGPGRARNWAWDHSISIGAEWHWVFDDNIKHFYRLNDNSRYRVMSGAIFNAMEDFTTRYENVYIAGPNYYFFCADSQTYPPYVPNTRIYSALFIRNDCKHRWRGRYNEDTDLSLRVLKDGDATIQFNAFLQGKMGTQLLKGGNTEEFYHKEGQLDKEKWRGGNMNAEGTVNKSKMLVDMHPDVATLVWKYGRWHHFVDYSIFRKNELKLKPGVTINRGALNEYGLHFVDDYDDKAEEYGCLART